MSCTVIHTDQVRLEDLVILQGSLFDRWWPVLDDDDVLYPSGALAGWTARGKIRALGGVELYSWASPDIGIDVVESRLVLRVPAATSSGWSAYHRDWQSRPRYDIELIPVTPAGAVYRRLQGRITLDPEQTY